MPILTLALFCIKDRAWEGLEILISTPTNASGCQQILNKFKALNTNARNGELRLACLAMFFLRKSVLFREDGQIVPSLKGDIARLSRFFGVI